MSELNLARNLEFSATLQQIGEHPLERSLDSRGCNDLAAVAYLRYRERVTPWAGPREGHWVVALDWDQAPDSYKAIWRLIVQSVLSSVPIALQYGSDQLAFTAFTIYQSNVCSKERWADQTPATKANWEWVVLAICLHLVEAIAWEHGTDQPGKP
jgi:hypothetical protein